jgi:hypothetical protein
MERRFGALVSFSWLEIGGGMAACVAVFAVLLAVSGHLATTFEWGVESLVAGAAVTAFFVFLVGGIARLRQLSVRAAGLWITFIAVACLVVSFLSPVGFDGALIRGPHAAYVAFSVFSGGWYLLILGISVLSTARQDRRKG